ncbi:MAG: hypothetical protein J2P25_04610 [Nocardiopsaceae bacterium]|nr:hypothetical protein [Nocardiopsaceae bacterium]
MARAYRANERIGRDYNIISQNILVGVSYDGEQRDREPSARELPDPFSLTDRGACPCPH